MAERTIITLVCDLHGEESNCQDVGTHTLILDRKTRTFEVCAREWTKVERATGALMAAGRTAPAPPSRKGAGR